MEIEAYTVTRAPPVHVYRRGPETHMEQKQYPQVFRAHHDHQYSTCSVAFSPCMQHATSTSIDIFTECPYHPQTIHTHTHVDTSTKAANNTDALTAPATPPLHPKALSPLHQHRSLLAAFPPNAQRSFPSFPILFLRQRSLGFTQKARKSKINQNMLDTGREYIYIFVYVYVYILFWLNILNMNSKQKCIC